MEAMSPGEVGLSHPTLPLAFRLMNDGRIAVLAGDNGSCGLILDSNNGIVTLFGNRLDFIFDEIRIDGLAISKSRITSDEKEAWSKIVERGRMRADIIRSSE